MPRETRKLVGHILLTIGAVMASTLVGGGLYVGITGNTIGGDPAVLCSTVASTMCVCLIVGLFTTLD